jgi:hypothetical protein
LKKANKVKKLAQWLKKRKTMRQPSLSKMPQSVGSVPHQKVVRKQMQNRQRLILVRSAAVGLFDKPLTAPANRSKLAVQELALKKELMHEQMTLKKVQVVAQFKMKRKNMNWSSSKKSNNYSTRHSNFRWKRK